VNIPYENEGKKQICVGQKYVPSVDFVKSVVRLAFKCLSLSGLCAIAQGMLLSLSN